MAYTSPPRGQPKIIACQTVLKIEGEAPAGLHLHPHKIRSALQAMINHITARAETIILGCGVCGFKGTDLWKRVFQVPAGKSLLQRTDLQR